MALPGLFNLRWDQWTLYQLITYARLLYAPTATRWGLIRQALQTHYTREEYGGGPDLPYPRACLLNFSEHQLVIVRGSADARDWANGLLNIASVTAPQLPGGFIAPGFQLMGNALWDAMIAGNFNAAKPTIFVGHSLGGALAAYLHFRLKRLVFPTEGVSVSFGAPKVGNRAFWGQIEESHIRVMHGGDYVTELPPNGFRVVQMTGGLYRWTDDFLTHSGNTAWFDRQGFHATSSVYSTQSAFDFGLRHLESRGVSTVKFQEMTREEQFDDHRSGRYAVRLRRDLQYVPQFQVDAFDAVNTQLNTEEALTGVPTGVYFRPVPQIGTRLPLDPIEELPMPAEEFEADPPPPVIPGPGPGGVAAPPNPRIFQEQARRRRRQLG